MERCINHFKTEYSYFGTPIPPKEPLQLFGITLNCAEASEPSNIIWENLQDPDHLLLKRKIVAFTIILMVFACIFLLFAYLKVTVYSRDKQYPKTTNCDLMKISDDANSLRIAEMDKINTLKEQGLGYYQCFCEKYGQKNILSMKKTDTCYDYVSAKFLVLAIKNLMTVAIVILNTILRIINIFLVQKIGFNKQSEVTMTIMTFVFYSQYLNTGLILLLTNADFTHTPL